MGGRGSEVRHQEERKRASTVATQAICGAPTPSATDRSASSEEHVRHTSAARLKIQKNAIIAALL